MARYPCQVVHLDVKKVGRIPDAGGWRAHGRGSEAAKAVDRAKAKGAQTGYVYLHSAVDGFSRLAYTEALPDEKAITTIAFWARARAFFAAHAINRSTRVVTDNGSNYRAKDFTRSVLVSAAKHQRIRPYTPKHNGKVERYNRTLAEEFLYSRIWISEQQRADAITTWNIHNNYCESWSGWSGTGWQGGYRAALAPRSWLIQLFAPTGCVSMDMSDSRAGWPVLAWPTPMA